jgi:hypothetical protein
MSIDAPPPPPPQPPDASPPPEPIDQPTIDNAAELPSSAEAAPSSDNAGPGGLAPQDTAPDPIDQPTATNGTDAMEGPAQAEGVDQTEAISQVEAVDQRQAVDQVMTIGHTEAVDQREAAQTRSEVVDPADAIDQATVENASELGSTQPEASPAADEAATEELTASEETILEEVAVEQRAAAELEVEAGARDQLDEVQADSPEAERFAKVDKEEVQTAQAQPESGAEDDAAPEPEPATRAETERERAAEAEPEPVADAEVAAERTIDANTEHDVSAGIAADEPAEFAADQLLDQIEQAATDSPLSDVLPTGAGLAIPAARAVVALWEGREVIAADLRRAAGEMVRFAYGEGRDAQIESRVNELSQQTQSAPIEWQSFESIREAVERVDVTTDHGTAVFYGGRDPVFRESHEVVRNRAVAESYAFQAGKTTLEMTAGRAWLEEQLGTEGDPNPNISSEQRAELWDRLSERYAENASGEVVVFHRLPSPENASGDTWQRIELPALLANPQVGRTNIWIY